MALEVDLEDPDALMARIAEVHEVVGTKYVEVNRLAALLREAQDELAHWIGMQNRLAVLAGLPQGGPQESQREMIEAAVHAAGPFTLQGQCEAIVNGVGIPVSASDVLRHLPPGTKRERVNWALWKAHREGRLMKLEPGVYAALGPIPNSSEKGA